MGKIEITHIDEAPWISDRDVQTGPRRLGVQIIGDVDEGLRALIVAQPPGHKTKVHSHSETEIIHILEGDIKVGNRTLGPGTCLFIEHDTQYQFTVGDEGVRFMNIRPGPSEYHPVGEESAPEVYRGVKK
jgi:hypothetical protein